MKTDNSPCEQIASLCSQWRFYNSANGDGGIEAATISLNLF